MNGNRTDYVIRNLISSMINSMIGTILPFFVRTLTIRCLGSEYMGLNSLCVSILYILNASNLGVDNAFAYRLYKPMAQKNADEICKLLNFYKKAYFVIGCAVFCTGLCLMPFLEYFISGDVPRNINIYIVFFIYLLNSSLSYWMYSYKNLIFIADQRADYGFNICSVIFILLYGGQILLILMHQYYFYVCMFPISTFFMSVIRSVTAKVKYPQYMPRGNVESQVKRNMCFDILSAAVFKLRDISRNAFDNIIISAFAGLIVLSDYQNYYMVVTIPNLLFTIFYTSIQPSVGNCVVTEEIETTYHIYCKNVFILMFLGGWFAICYCFLIQDFIVLWLGIECLMPDTFAVLFAVFIYLQAVSLLTRLIRESAGLWNYGRLCAGAEIIVNIALNVILIMRIGLEGILLATIISMLLISIPAENYIIYKHYFVGKFSDSKKLILLNIAWAAGTAVITGLLCQWGANLHELKLVKFLYKIFICIVVPPVSLTVCFHRTEEFQFIMDMAKQILCRKNK